MSGEFGNYNGSGYFHNLVAWAAEDCEGNRHVSPVTSLIGDLLAALAPVARGISWCEAYDSGPDRPIVDLHKQMPEIRKAVKAIEEFISPFERVVADALADAARKESK